MFKSSLLLLTAGLAAVSLCHASNSIGSYNSISNSNEGLIFLSGVGNAVEYGADAVNISGFFNAVNYSGTIGIFGYGCSANSSTACMLNGFNSSFSASRWSVFTGWYNNANSVEGCGAFGGNNIMNTVGNSWILGSENHLNNTWNSIAVSYRTRLTAARECLSLGNSNTVEASLEAWAVGSRNTLTDCADSLALGNDITLQGVQSRPGFGAGNLFAMGSSLNAEPAAGFYGLVLLGFHNAPVPLAGDIATDNAPLLIVGNGKSAAARSNAMVLEKSGRLTLTHRAYAAATPPAAQPETLVVEGASKLKGGLAVTGPVSFARQGDIGMGDFGLPADQGPVN